MARQSDVSIASTAGARVTDVFVIFAVTVVSLAAGAWLLQRLSLRLWTGLAVALAIYAVLLATHLLLRRAFRGGRQVALPEAEFDPWAHEKATEPEFATTFGKRTGLPPGLTDPPHTPLADMPLDPFSFRPSSLPSLQGPEPALAAALPPQPAAEVTKAAVSAPPEMTVEMIESLVKKLADELSATPSTPPKIRGKLVPQADPETTDAESMVDRSIAALEATARSMRAAAPTQQRAAAAPPPAPVPPQAAARKAPAQSQSPSLPAAHSAAPPAQQQRVQGDAARAVAPPAPPAAAKETPAVSPQLIRIAEAVAAERMDVLLEPIQSLAEGRTRHFEVSTRLLMADGSALDQQEVSRIAHVSGLMPRIDCARILRAARVARRLGDGGRTGSVITAVTGESLTDHRFLSTASAEQPANGTMHLVVSFQQAEVRIFSPGHVQTLSALSAAGFRFALDGVTDLDMDFGELKGMGFNFVKLDAPVFLEGLPAPSGLVPAPDICRMLTDHGLTLIVGRIDDDWQLARVLGLGVIYGRGSLFGAPRLVKPEVVAARPAPNAVA